MEHFVLRNRKQLDEFTEKLKERRLPMKVAVQSIYPERSVDANEYLWAVVYQTIAEATGQSKEEVHEGYKRKFNFKRDFFYNRKKDRYEVGAGTQSTTSLDNVGFWDYIMKVRADAEIDLHIVIPMPNEIFNAELRFEDHE